VTGCALCGALPVRTREAARARVTAHGGRRRRPTCIRCLKKVTARTLLPTESSGGEYTAMPMTLGMTMYTKPATPDLAGSPTRMHHSPL
jgi:hypothetical protein